MPNCRLFPFLGAYKVVLSTRRVEFTLRFQDVFASVVELVDTLDSKSGGFGRVGSTPTRGTTYWDAKRTKSVFATLTPSLLQQQAHATSCFFNQKHP